MKKVSLSLLLLVQSVCVFAGNSFLYQKLENAINNREQCVKVKEHDIDNLKRAVGLTVDNNARLKMYNEIAEKYYAFVYDSAMAYVNKGLKLAEKTHNSQYYFINKSHVALLFGSRGFYSEAKNILDRLNIKAMDRMSLFNYYYSYYKLYVFWQSYSQGNQFASYYSKQKVHYLMKAIVVAPKNSPMYDYLIGEYYIYGLKNFTKAKYYYNRVLKKTNIKNRLHATASYALAIGYRDRNNTIQYERHLIIASIVDMSCPVKENLALQDLAMFIYDKGDYQLEKAQRYIKVSMDDAVAYNNRLRIFEIATKMPVILKTYQDKVNRQNNIQKLALGFITLLLLGLISAIICIIRQNKQLTLKRKELSESNCKLIQLNGQLHTLNGQLIGTNRQREGLAKLYIDICAKYIDRLNRYQILVKRKIKANQVNELLTTISSSRLSEEDAAAFMNRFDKAFLDLYPTFVAELNMLLQPCFKIAMDTSRTMSTELRIFALIRLGVKDSSEIAALLFYSPQTIYNYRSAVKNKAICRDTFENDVMNLCITNEM
jgi:hypothetical protein